MDRVKRLIIHVTVGPIVYWAFGSDEGGGWDQYWKDLKDIFAKQQDSK